ncbi:calcium-binding mitochondrial carrier S -2 isoform X2 [Brachionus plicatilis]|uniref:Calcium-binding mitochondrial carrier S-2 isoform X2 n=1 Tax=Brachionus plicatilis TaxID=10195 RepID=A0A3M7QDY0_BRAPC|nr:calcium-binding mitochondrial carrier S -2 isoform X2 [Brachionus plicatilis]
MINLSEKDIQRYHEMFEKLDTNSDGKIDVYDLIVLFDKIKHPIENEDSKPSRKKESNLIKAKRFISRSDKNSSGDLNFNEFVQYMLEHENILELVFRGIDTNSDSKIGYDELIKYFKKFGIEISTNEAKKLVEKVNRNGSLVIEPKEWREYFSLAPIESIHDLLYHWRYSTLVDIGEGNTVPDDFSNEENRIDLIFRNLIAGAFAGAVSRTCTAPFDRLKTVMQALGSRKKIKVIGGFGHMLKEGGLRSLWRGNGMNVIKIAPEAALKFTFYEELKTYFIKDKNREANVFERFCAGSMAGALAQSTIYPMELLKTRMVLGKTGEYSSIFDCAGKIIKYEGLLAFYKGFVPNILGIIPYAGTDLAVYETLKRFYMKKNQIDENPSIPILLMCGTTSTICGQLVSYPFSLIRTRLQAQEVPMDSENRDTMRKLLIRIWRNEGLRGFYRGLLPNIIKVVPAVSISYVVYENVKNILISVKNKENT